MKIEFINKIWVKGTGKVSTLRKVLLVCAFILLFISFVQFLLGGIDDVNWLTGILLPICMLIYYRLNYNSDGYIGVRCDFRIENDGFHVYYYDIDYQDGNGTHAEHIYIPYTDIKAFQYSKELMSVRVMSQPVISMNIRGQEKVMNYKVMGTTYTCILYFPPEQIDKILNYIYTNCPISVVHMDR